jgi:hypothetical protein
MASHSPNILLEMVILSLSLTASLLEKNGLTLAEYPARAGLFYPLASQPHFLNGLTLTEYPA